MKIRILLVGALAAALLAPAAMALAGTKPLGAQLAEVRRATVAYQDVAAAEAAGYGQVPGGCVPHMGYHYMRGGPIAADQLVPTEPNLLVYAPQPNGKLRLVAVEYGSMDADAMLFGQTFDPPGGAPFHTLHAWVWQANPHGTFAAHNPNITC